MLILIGSLISCINLFGQATQTINLKPITKQGFRYYYDFKKVDGGAYGLQVPLQSLNDPEIDLRYKNFKKLRAIGGFTMIVPVVYLFSSASSNNSSGRKGGSFISTTFWTLYLASLASYLGFEIAAQHHLKKGIDRYNETILRRNTIGLHIEPIENQLAIGIGFARTF